MTSTVWFTPLSNDSSLADRVAAVDRLWQAADVGSRISSGQYVAIKVHVGDEKNTTHLPAELVTPVVRHARERDALPFLTETSTLYAGARHNAVRHILHAASHGFTIERTGVPFIMADGLAGDAEIEVPVDGELFSSVSVAREARMADVLIVMSHMTGHLAAGFGATIKNLGMGLASRKGKMRQHSSIKPEIRPDKCTLCGKCMEWCPESCIAPDGDAARIDSSRCIGCGECLAVCRFGAVRFDWEADASWMQQAMAEHALGVVKDRPAFHINYCCTMTKDCDCFPIHQDPAIPDVGIVASFDPVAVDQAALDLTRQDDGRNLAQIAFENVDGCVQLVHAEKIGLGSRTYELVELP